MMCLGGVRAEIETDERIKAFNMLHQLGIPPWRCAKLMNKCCFSVAASTADILIRRLKER